jgi:hypothetical protein
MVKVPLLPQTAAGLPQIAAAPAANMSHCRKVTLPFNLTAAGCRSQTATSKFMPADNL